MPTPKNNQTVKGDIVRLLKERDGFYGRVWIRTLIVRDSVGNQWRHGATRIQFLQKNEAAPEQLRWEYENAILLKAVISQEEFVALLDSIVEKSQLELSEIPSVALKGQFSWEEYLHSREWRFALSWPANYYLFKLDGGATPRPHGALVSVKYPAFIDGYELIKEQVGVDIRQQDPGSVNILLPNYLARIDGLKIGFQRLSVSVTTLGLPLSALVAKVHVVETRGHRSLHEDIVFQQETETLSLGFVPGEVYLGLLLRKKGDVLDVRQFYVSSLGSLTSPRDVEWEPMVEEEIEAYLLQGENERVEFKLNFGNGGELAETVVAFANRSGGVILVGVDNYGNVAGLASQNAENTITNIVRHYCEPPVEPTVEIVEIRGKSIVAIKVKEGPDKPYTHKEKGVMVRIGSTDRVATRDELDGFYRRTR